MKKKRTFITFFLILCSVSLFGQKNNFTSKRDSIILMDSIWLKNEQWKTANVYTYKIANPDADQYPKFHFDEVEAKKVVILPIPIYTLNKNVMKYKYGKDFNTIISRDSFYVAGYINYRDKIIGYLYADFVNGEWKSGELSIFPMQNMVYDYVLLTPSKSVRDLFLINDIRVYCYRIKDSIYALDPFKMKFVPIEEYIKERVHLDALRDCFKCSREDANKEMR